MIRRIGLGMLLALVLGTLASAGWLAGTEPGARVLIRWTSGLLPYVKLRHESGSLAGPLHLRVVDIRLRKSRVHLTNLRLDWSWSCLLVGEACLSELSADTLSITLAQPPAAKPGTTPVPFRMPQLRLPLVLDAGRVHVGQLNIARGDKLLVTLVDIDTALRWSGDTMAIDHLRVAMPQWEAHADGSLGTTGDWDVDLRCRFRAPRQGPAPFTLDGRAHGSLTDLRVEADSGGFIVAQLSGAFALFAPGLPFSVNATAPQWRVPAAAPDEKATRVGDIRLRAEGLLTGRFRLTGDALIDTPWMPPLPARLDAHATVRGVQDGFLLFDDPRLAAKVATRYGWVGTQTVALDAAIRHLDLSLVTPALPSSLAGEVRLDGTLAGDATDIRIDIATLRGALRGRPVQADGRLRWQDARLHFDGVTLASGASGANRARLGGELGDRWNADAVLELGDLAALHPGLAGAAQGSARLSGPPAAPRAAFRLEARGLALPGFDVPLGGTRHPLRFPVADWQATGEAGLKDLRLDALQAQGEDFRVDASGELAWADALDWAITARLDAFPPGRLTPGLAGRLSGPVQVSGQWKDHLRALQLDAGLDGRLDGAPLAVHAGVDYRPGRVQVRRGELRHGANRLRARGTLSGQSLDFDADIEAPALADSFRDLAGSLSGSIRLGGSPERPDALLSLEAAGLEAAGLESTGPEAAAGLSLRRGTASLSLRNGGFTASRLSVMAEGLRQDAAEPLDAVFLADGTRDAHRMTLDARRAALLATLAIEGRLDLPAGAAPEWQGALREGSVQWHDWQWRATGEPALAFREDALHLDPHCWTDAVARACVTAPALLGKSGTLQAEAFHLPPGMLAADFLPTDALTSGQVGAVFSAQWTDAVLDALSFDLRNATPLVFSEPLDDGSPREVARIETLSANGTLDGTDGTLQAALSGDALGTVSANARLDTRSRALAGAIDIQAFNVGIADAFTYLAHDIGGTVNARIDMGGTLDAPQLTGSARLTDGRLSFVRQPVTLDRIRLDGRFDGHRMSLDGALRTPQSPEDVRIGGEFRLGADGWHGQATAKGAALVFSVPPQYDVTTSPDLRARLDGIDWLLEGTVGIPQARIDVRALPTQSVELSRDVILSHEAATEGARRKLMTTRTDIHLQLGQDVRFSAFGAEGLLAGNLRLRKRPDLPMLVDGELLIREGRYGIFGQTLALRQANLIFNGPVDQPLIDALAVREINDPAMKEAGVELTGSLRRPETRLWSTPEVPQNEALTWLLTGRAPSDDPINYRGEAASAALSLGVAQGSALLNQAGKKLGLKEFQLSAGGDGEETEVEVGTAVSERLYIGYNRRVFSGEDSLLVRLRMTRRLVMEAVSGLESALDVYYTFEF